MRIDGDALRAARRENQREAITYTLGGVDFEFPPDVSLEAILVTNQAVAERWADQQYVPAWIEHVLGPDQWKRLRVDVAPSFTDLQEMYEAVMTKGYGTDPGESGSSPDSSAPSGESSKPKSKGSTTKTRQR